MRALRAAGQSVRVLDLGGGLGIGYGTEPGLSLPAFANTVRRADPLLVEAALTLGARDLGLVGRVIVPSVLPQIYRDQRILLGWAWTYLIVAELIGTSTGITFFITQQARYQHFANVYAGILVIGFVGIATDLLLALLGRRLFPWAKGAA